MDFIQLPATWFVSSHGSIWCYLPELSNIETDPLWSIQFQFRRESFDVMILIESVLF